MSQPYSAPPPYSPQSSDAYPPQQPMMNQPPPYSPQVYYVAQPPPNAYPPNTVIQYVVQSPPPTNANPYIVTNQPVFYSSNPVFQTTATTPLLDPKSTNLYPQFELQPPMMTNSEEIEHFVDQAKINANSALPKDLLYMGTTGRLTAFNLSQKYESSKQIEKQIPIEWVQNLGSTSTLGRFHNTAFCLHHSLPIIFTIFNGNVLAISADRGDIIWSSRPNTANKFISDDLGTISISPLIPNKIFVGTSGHGICLSQSDGKVLWETNLKKTGWNNVAILPISHEIVVMGSMGICYALDAKTGKILWENKLEGTGYGDLSLAKYCVNTHGTYKEDVVIVGTNGYLVNLNPTTGETKAKANLKGTGYHSVSLLVDQESHLLFVVTNGKAYAYNPENLNEVWKNEMKGMGILPGQGAVTMGDNLIVGTFGKVMCMNKKSGTSLWTCSLPSCGYDLVTVFVYNNRLLAGSNGKMYELNAENGTVIWRDNLKGYSYSHLYLGCYGNFGYTDHNSTTIVQFIAEGRRSNQ